MVTARMILPDLTWTVMALMFTPSALARAARKLYAVAPVKSEGFPAMVNVAETTTTAAPPGGAGGGEGGGGDGGGDG